MSKLIKNNWENYKKDGNPKYLSWYTRVQWFFDYGNNPTLWWNIYVSNNIKNDYGTWWYKFKRTKLFFIILLIFIIKILYPELPILSLINITK